MSQRLTHELLLGLLDDDDALLQALVERQIMPPRAGDYEPLACEDARIAHTLVRLEVNLEGVEIILRLRRELLATRRQVAGLLLWMQRSAPPDGLP